MNATDGQEWLEYYERFAYFSADAVRDGCHPRLFKHTAPSDKAIVLVHGLTDSPYFMTAIARHFHTRLGYDAYLPLLHCHGLKQPNDHRVFPADRILVAHALAAYIEDPQQDAKTDGRGGDAQG